MRKTGFRKLLAVAVLCALLSTPASAAGKFQDVPAGYWAAGAIERCVKEGYFKGETADFFGVGHHMTRSAFVVVLSRFFDWETTSPVYSIYEDVPVDAWYAGALQAAYEKGAVTRQTSTFRPKDPITREEMAVMLVRALGYGTIAGLAQEDELSFEDIRTNRGYIAMAYELGIVNGVSAAAFAPGRTATREQAAVMLMRLHDRLAAEPKETVGIVKTGEAAPDWSLVQTAAIAAGKLTGGSVPRVTEEMPQEETTALAAAAKEAGVTALLHLSGGTAVLGAEPEKVAAAAVSAMDAGGYDGVYLELDEKAGGDAALGKLAAELRRALGERPLYVSVNGPVRNEEMPDYRALGAVVDQLVVKTAAGEERSGNFPIAPPEAQENLYYALKILTDQVAPGRLTLQLSTEGTVWKNGWETGTMTGAQIEEFLAQEDTHAYYSDDYAGAYAQNGTTVVWYLNDKAAAVRRQMAGCFGVKQICLSDFGRAPAVWMP